MDTKKYNKNHGSEFGLTTNFFKLPKIFFLAGTTGGPLIPLIPIAQNLSPKFSGIFLGVKGGFEEVYLKDYNYPLVFLLKAKYNLGTFKKQSLTEIFVGLIDTVYNTIKLVLNFWISCYLLLKFRPVGIVTAGSFLNIPVIKSATFLKKLRLIKTKIIIHQQDPIPGISNRLCASEADFLTCKFLYTVENYPKFKKAKLIPNPINIERFKIDDFEDQSLATFIKKQPNKPILFIFGGGSGSEFINRWLAQNLLELTPKYKIIHLTGRLQTKSFEYPKSEDLWQSKSLINDMPPILKFSDLVIARAGISTISELELLDKTAFLVPIPNSHQELNAELLKTKFAILEQKNSQKWLEKVLNVKLKTKNNQIQNDPQLQEYYQSLLTLLDN